MDLNNLLTKLNNKQLQAVKHLQGPLLIVAGAGTGKTTVLINRLAYLIIEKKFNPEDILLLTFTEKASAEMEARADQILPYGYLNLWINTFHGFCERILRDQALEIGLSSDFKLLNNTEQWILIKQNLNKFNLNYYRPLNNPTKFISELIRHFSRLKDENISSDAYLKNTKQELNKKNTKADLNALLEAEKNYELACAYQTYNQLLLENNYFDFGDLIIKTLELFKERPNILKFYQEKFKQIMVDEFQDTNTAQYQLVQLLAQTKNNLVVVGDDDQAIYKFRGASIANIMQFKVDYPQAKEIVLTNNYRSQQEILDYAYQFIQHNNPNRLEEKLKIKKRLKSLVKNNKTPSLYYYNFNNYEEEIDFVVGTIRTIYETSKNAKNKESLNWSDFAVLVRANDTANNYLQEFIRQEIPHQFMSWRGLYYKSVILDILAYLRLLHNYYDLMSLHRVLSMDIFKISHAELVTINEISRKKLETVVEVLDSSEISKLKKSSQVRVAKLLEIIKNHSKLVPDTPPSKLLLHFAYDSGFLKNLDPDRDLETFSYLNQFYQKIKSFELNNPEFRLKDFLDNFNLEIEAGDTGALKLDFNDDDTVKIMTIHAAKGLEFKHVFVVNLVDKKFPTISRSDKFHIPQVFIKSNPEDAKNFHLEEERRLFYVAITRAKDGLYLSSARDYGGLSEKKSSKFIEELNLENKENNLKRSKLKSKDLLLANLFWKDLQDLSKTKKATEKNLIELKKEIINYKLPKEFSFSQLEAFAVCPLQYKYAFVLKVPAPKNKPALIFGKILHDTLYEFLLKNLSNPQAINSFVKLSSIYQKLWQLEGFNSLAENQEYHELGEKIIKTFYHEFKNNPPQEILFLEKACSIKIGQDIIKGKIDRVDRLIDGKIELIDYKTGKTKDDLTYKDKRQLILYQIFLEENLGLKVDLLSYYYLESGLKQSFVSTEKEKDKLKSNIIKEMAEIKRQRFIPKPGLMCKYCDYKDICEFGQF